MKAPKPTPLYNVVLYYGDKKQGVLHYNLHYGLALQKRNALMATKTINATRRVHIEPIDKPTGKTKQKTDMNHKTRITGQDSTISGIMKMAGSNPGAMDALMKILTAVKVDPDALIGPILHIMMLDTLGIYETDIYVLFGDICNKNVAKTMAVIRATQLGMFDGNVLKDACSRQDRSGRSMVPVEELYAKVKERLPMFDMQPETV